jgi:hypothetical protein
MQVKVWNDNKYPHVEKFKGDTIRIPAGGYVEMDLYDATDFRGQYTPIVKGADEQPMPQSYKIIRIERPSDAKVEASSSFQCQACGKSYESQKVLDAHTDENHLDQLAEPDVAQKRRGRPRKEAV